MTGDERLTQVGSFRVDRAAALRKLMLFQFPDPLYYPIPWVGCAVAGGATHIEIGVKGRRFEMRFDGKPWHTADLEDPYRALFDSDSTALDRHRYLATGLLASLRLAPKVVEVRSRFLGRETILRTSDTSSEIVETNPVASSLPPRVKFVIDWLKSGCFRVDVLSKYLAHCPVPISVNKKLLIVARGQYGDCLRIQYQHDSVSADISLSAEESNGRVDLVKHGIIVDTLSPDPTHPAVISGVLHCDALSLDLSCQRVVKDEHFELVRRELDFAFEELIRSAAGKLCLLAPSVGAALQDPMFRAQWIPEGGLWGFFLQMRSFFDLNAIWRAARLMDRAILDKIRQASSLARVLRRLALESRDQMSSQRRLANVLWNAPLLFDVSGLPLSLRELEEQRAAIGSVWCSRDVERAQTKCLIAWTPSAADFEFLCAFFPDDVRWVPTATPFRLLARENMGKRKTGLIADAEDYPHEMLVTSTVDRPGCGYVVGLSLSPHESLSRIWSSHESRPDAVAVFSAGGLRFDILAYPTRPERTLQPEATDLVSIHARLPELYARLSRLYDPSEDSLRQAMTREHLLDLLASSWDAKERRFKENDWLGNLRLFRTVEGASLSMRDIQFMVSAHSPITLLATMHSYRLHGAVAGYPQHAVTLFSGIPEIRFFENMVRSYSAPAADRLEEPRGITSQMEDGFVSTFECLVSWIRALFSSGWAVAEQPGPQPAVPFRASSDIREELMRRLDTVSNNRANDRRRPPPETPPGDSGAALQIPEPEHWAVTLPENPLAALRASLFQVAAATGFAVPAGEITGLIFEACGDGMPLVSRNRHGQWRINTDHALAWHQASSQDSARWVPFLASAVITAMSREMPADFEPSHRRLQAALAAWSCELSGTSGRE